MRTLCAIVVLEKQDLIHPMRHLANTTQAASRYASNHNRTRRCQNVQRGNPERQIGQCVTQSRCARIRIDKLNFVQISRPLVHLLQIPCCEIIQGSWPVVIVRPLFAFSVPVIYGAGGDLLHNRIQKRRMG